MNQHKVSSFSGIEWGPDEARGDSRLPTYFVKIPEFDSIVQGRHRYVIGRKGTGKTAVLERIRQLCDKNPLCFYSDLSLRNFPVQSLRALRDPAYRDKAQYVPIWTFLFAIEIARMLLRDNSLEDEDTVKDLRSFLRTNDMLDRVGFVETVTHLQSKKSKVSVLAKWLGGEYTKQGESQSQIPVHYQRATDMLLERLSTVTSDCTYHLLMDELDEGYTSGDPGIRLLLLALLRATEDVAIRFQNTHLHVRPVLALRSDIFDRLEDNDLNKLDDSLVRICWQGATHGKYSLRKIVDARICASLSLEPGQDPWDAVVHDTDSCLPRRVRSLWSYIVNRTFERPRDLVKFLKLCGRQGGMGRLAYDAVSQAEYDFSDWLYRELRDEIHAHLPVWKESLQCITRIGTGVFGSDQLMRELDSDPGVSAWERNHGRTSKDIIECLFDFGVLGNLSDHRKWLFHYKDPDLVWNPRMRLIVHFGFHKKLRLARW